MGAREDCDAFNAKVAAICETHPELHKTCVKCGKEWCLYWTDSDYEKDDPVWNCFGCREPVK